MLERTKRILFRIYSVFIQGGLRTFTPAPTGSGSATLRVKSIKKTIELVQIYCQNCKKVRIITIPISLHFSVFSLNFSLLEPYIHILNADPDPGGKMKADLCGSGSTVGCSDF